MDDEDSILPRKLQVALEHVLDQRSELASDPDDGPLECKCGKCCSASWTSSPLPPLVREQADEAVAPLGRGSRGEVGGRGVQGETPGAHPFTWVS